jgi:antitoxin component of RelBE/YafQ-DinJ toxin-antitoxin module
MYCMKKYTNPQNDHLLQVRINKELKIEAERIAKAQGFHNVQQLIRMMLIGYVEGDIELTFEN